MSGPNGEPQVPAGNAGHGEEGDDDGFGDTGLDVSAFPPSPCKQQHRKICSNKLHAGPDQLLFGSPGGEE
ncbi:unnamed protein product [Caretta caretta]